MVDKETLDIDTVIAKGKVLVSKGESIIKPTFE